MFALCCKFFIWSAHRYMREDYHWAIFIDQLTDVMQLSARQSLNLASITTLFSEVGHPSCRDEKRRKFYVYVCVTWPTSENSKRFFERKISSPYQLPHYIACRTASYSLFWQSSLIYLCLFLLLLLSIFLKNLTWLLINWYITPNVAPNFLIRDMKTQHVFY